MESGRGLGASQGVGYEWDAVILTKSSATDVPTKIKKVIEGVFNEWRLDPFSPVLEADGIQPPRNWKAQLRNFSEDILSPESCTRALTERLYGAASIVPGTSDKWALLRPGG